ncbi:MAG: cytochrome c [Vicinamibacterales bacterium]
MARYLSAAISAGALVVACASAWPAALPAAARAVFTTSQATAGKAAYAKACAVCHMADLSGNNDIPPLAGKEFLRTWASRSTKEFIDYMAAGMPPGGPPLNEATALAIAAYVLHTNGATAGAEPLGVSTSVPIGSLTASLDEAAAQKSTGDGSTLPGPRNQPE